MKRRFWKLSHWKYVPCLISTISSFVAYHLTLDSKSWVVCLIFQKLSPLFVKKCSPIVASKFKTTFFTLWFTILRIRLYQAKVWRAVESNMTWGFRALTMGTKIIFRSYSKSLGLMSREIVEILWDKFSKLSIFVLQTCNVHQKISQIILNTDLWQKRFWTIFVKNHHFWS